ncbi:MAG: response regulator [Proteobacteria bacterium]|nr:response regulator [Pseudomonadota bacterium]
MAHTVLVVEDNALNLRLFNDLLQAKGYNTLNARSGPEALEIMRAQRPDLVLMDIQLPGMSGIEATQEIRKDEALKTVPVVAVTAFAMKGDEETIRKGGCDAYISKPISVPDFFATIARFLAP